MLAKLMSNLSNSFSKLTDNRKPSPNKTYTIQEVAMSAFSVFFLQSPSFLEHQRRFEKTKQQNNGRSLFGIETLPSDNQIRNLMDEVNPEEFEESFKILHDSFELVGDHKHVFEWDRGENTKGFLVPLDGSEFFSSKNIQCPCCLKKEHGKPKKNKKISDQTSEIDKEELGEEETTTYYSHAMVCPIIVHPDSSFVLPLMPEFIQNSDGSEKQDCEINASKRWIEKNKAWLTENKVTFLGDDLYSRSPLVKMIQALKDVDFIFTCKPTSHTYLLSWLKDFEKNDWGTFKTTETKGNKCRIYTYKFANQVPLCAEKDSPLVNYFEMEVLDTKGKRLYRNSYVASYTLTASRIHKIGCAGRSRWKIENEAFNVLKNNGYHFEHNFGHGKKHLSNTLACFNLMAFLMHSLANFLDCAYRAVRDKLPAKKYLFEILCYAVQFLIFDNWDHLFRYLANDFL
jgi:hypothetical protein